MEPYAAQALGLMVEYKRLWPAFCPCTAVPTAQCLLYVSSLFLAIIWQACFCPLGSNQDTWPGSCSLLTMTEKAACGLASFHSAFSVGSTRLCAYRLIFHEQVKLPLPSTASHMLLFYLEHLKVNMINWYSVGHSQCYILQAQYICYVFMNICSYIFYIINKIPLCKENTYSIYLCINRYLACRNFPELFEVADISQLQLKAVLF